jgi:DNA-binding ferritin-like protein (Dps family)
MSLFKKPTKEDRRLKLYVYGESGTGKSVTSLYMPSPAVVDLDGGTDFYVDKFDMVRIKTTDIDVVNKAVDELIDNPSGVKTLVIDGMTNYWDLLQDKHLKRLRVKKGKPDYTFQPIDYKLLQADIRAFINKLLALDLNIVMTAKSKKEYSADSSEFMKVIGQKADGPKEVPYLFDVVLELSFGPNETRIARVIKDRTNTLPKEFEYSYQELTKYLDMKELEREPVQLRAVQRLNQVVNRTSSITLDGQAVMTAGITADTLAKLREVIPHFEERELKDKLSEDYFVSSLLDLKEDEARQFLTDLQSKLA